MSGLTLDTGALIAFERNDRSATNFILRAIGRDLEVAIPAAVLAQAWRDGARQARLARLLKSSKVKIERLDSRLARDAGQLCGMSNTSDVVDASVVVCARRRKHAVMTSDPDDIRRLDPSLVLEVV